VLPTCRMSCGEVGAVRMVRSTNGQAISTVIGFLI
jgi:hypothetical protein